jgi:hypothetical protein
MIFQFQIQGDVFFLEFFPHQTIQDIFGILYKVIQIRQAVHAYCTGDSSRQDLYDRTVHPRHTIDKHITTLDGLISLTKDHPLQLKEIDPFKVTIFGKTLEDGKKLGDYLNMKMKKTVIKPILSEDTLKQFPIVTTDLPIQNVRFFEERPNKKQKMEDVISGVVPDNELENIGKSLAIKEKLANPKIQHMMLDIDQSQDRVKALREAMKDPDFDILMSELMYLVGER